MSEKHYDFIIVGGGTAGLVVAARLTENPNISVLVLEAGIDASADPRVTTPGLVSAVHNSEHDWSFATVPQENLAGRKIGYHQGKLLGGSSAINVQALIPPSASDLNAWEPLGNRRWGWDSIKTYLHKAIAVTKPDQATSEHLHLSWVDETLTNGDGPIKASFTDIIENPVGKAWVETIEGLGYPLSDSPFNGLAIGAYSAASTVDPDTKTRSDSYRAYCLPNLGRENLEIRGGCHVEKIILEPNGEGQDHIAVGIQYTAGDRSEDVRVKREVILCAGVFQSPKILELSGLGDPNILSTYGIEVKVANPYVGTNLNDHLMHCMSFEVNDDVTTADNLLRQDPEAIKSAFNEYHNHKTGPLCSTGVTSMAYLPVIDFAPPQNTQERDAFLEALSRYPTTHPLDEARRVSLTKLILTGQEGTSQYFLFLAQTNTYGRDTTRGPATDLQPGNFLTICVTLAHPLSTGTCHISSASAAAPPTIDPNFLSNPLDLELQARHVRFVETITSTPPFSDLLKPGGKRDHPKSFIGGNMERAKEFVKMAGTTVWHGVGTCAMAPKEKGGVVDDRLRVYGVKGLRVVDASVMPLVPQSNTQSLVYAVAEKAADLIKEDYRE